jgi:hypothetical protein
MAADEKRAHAEPMARIEDLLHPNVRQALADLAAAPQPAGTDHLGDVPLEHVGDRGNGEADVQYGLRPASPPQQNQPAPHSPVERPYPKPRAPFKVIVTTHARERARERFPGFKAARIGDEVHAALVAGRVSALKPPGLIGGDFPYGLYAWTEDGNRIYGLRYGEDCFAVHTTMRRGAVESDSDAA